MKKEKVLVFGAGVQLSIVIDIIEKEGKYEIGGIIDSRAEIGSVIYGYEVLGRQEDIADIWVETGINKGIITLGDNYSRFKVMEAIDERIIDFEWINTIHPSVIIGNNTKLGEGIVCMAGVIFSPNCTIGDFCAFYTGAIIEHDNIVEDFASVSANSSTGGKVTIGQFSAICMGVTIFDRVNIGKASVIGSGSVVTRDIPDKELWYGNPARFIKNRELTDKYLK